jgi:hypothetical protein
VVQAFYSKENSLIKFNSQKSLLIDKPLHLVINLKTLKRHTNEFKVIFIHLPIILRHKTVNFNKRLNHFKLTALLKQRIRGK